jgi:hypothetical protein
MLMHLMPALDQTALRYIYFPYTVLYSAHCKHLITYFMEYNLALRQVLLVNNGAQCHSKHCIVRACTVYYKLLQDVVLSAHRAVLKHHQR